MLLCCSTNENLMNNFEDGDPIMAQLIFRFLVVPGIVMMKLVGLLWDS